MGKGCKDAQAARSWLDTQSPRSHRR